MPVPEIGTLLGTSDNLSAAGISSGSYNRFTFATPISLIVGQKYYIVGRRTGSRDLTNCGSFYVNQTDIVATQGFYQQDNNVWSAEQVWDLRYKTFDATPTQVDIQDTDNGSQMRIGGGTAGSGEIEQAEGYSYIPTQSFSLKYVDIKLGKLGSPVDNLNLFIYTVIVNYNYPGNLGRHVSVGGGMSRNDFAS